MLFYKKYVDGMPTSFDALQNIKWGYPHMFVYTVVSVQISVYKAVIALWSVSFQVPAVNLSVEALSMISMWLN